MADKKRILYLSTWDFTNEASDGVCKKIKYQIKAFEKKAIMVDFIYISDGEILFRSDGCVKKLGTVGSIRKTPAYLKIYRFLKDKKYDYIYNRYGMMDTFYYRLLKRLHKNGAKILIEIPTYPYIGERQRGIAYWLMFKWDALYLHKLKNVVDRIVTYSDDEQIFEIPTIHIMNGIDVDEINPKCNFNSSESVRLLALAYMQPHHGYERLIKGVYDYYRAGGKRDIKCTFAGEGPEVDHYKKLVDDYDLQKYFSFAGKQQGESLNTLLDNTDIGICSLGAYKKKVYLSSELKSREYFAKGIPICSGVTIDCFRSKDSKFYLEFPNDESPINMREVLDFYDEIYRKEDSVQEVVSQIRNYAEKYMDISATMYPVCRYILE